MEANYAGFEIMKSSVNNRSYAVTRIFNVPHFNEKKLSMFTQQNLTTEIFKSLCSKNKRIPKSFKT